METVEKLRRLDGDIEDFSFLLMLPLTHRNEKDKKNVNIRCADIVGPWVEHEKTHPSSFDVRMAHGGVSEGKIRDHNFSLLSMSFNLDPTHRHFISAEMNRMRSDFEMGTDNGNCVALIDSMKNSVSLKKNIVRKDLPDLNDVALSNSAGYRIHHDCNIVSGGNGVPFVAVKSKKDDDDGNVDNVPKSKTV